MAESVLVYVDQADFERVSPALKELGATEVRPPSKGEPAVAFVDGDPEAAAKRFQEVDGVERAEWNRWRFTQDSLA